MKGPTTNVELSLYISLQALNEPTLAISNNPLFLNPISDQVTFFNHIAGLNLVATLSTICLKVEYPSVVTLLLLHLDLLVK